MHSNWWRPAASAPLSALASWPLVEAGGLEGPRTAPAPAARRVLPAAYGLQAPAGTSHVQHCKGDAIKEDMSSMAEVLMPIDILATCGDTRNQEVEPARLEGRVRANRRSLRSAPVPEVGLGQVSLADLAVHGRADRGRQPRDPLAHEGRLQRLEHLGADRVATRAETV